MRILLVSPNTLIVPYPVYPIGLDYVAASVATHHEVKICDLNVISQQELIDVLDEFSPDIIGLSCRNIDNTEIVQPRYFIDEYAQLVALIKRHSKATVVCGGSGFTIMPEQVLTALGADYGLIGEGERFGQLVEAMEKGQNPESIAGVISANSLDSKTAPQPWTGKRVRGFRHDAPHKRFYLERGGMLNLQSKRGCSFRCIYCPYPAIEGGKHRLVDPQEVARTALQLEDAGAKYIFITDSAFNSDIDHSLAVAESFRAAGVSVPWGGFFAPVKLPEDYFAIMAKAGLAHIEFGTESLSDRMLQNYRKPFRTEDVFSAHQQAIDAGLHVAHYLLLGGPGESVETVRETLDTIDRLKKTVFFFFFGMRIYPQTGLYTQALEEGQIKTDTNLLQPLYYQSQFIDLQTIESLVNEKVGKRINCIVGSGEESDNDTMRKMYERGFVGPLWEFLIR